MSVLSLSKIKETKKNPRAIVPRMAKSRLVCVVMSLNACVGFLFVMQIVNIYSVRWLEKRLDIAPMRHDVFTIIN